MQRFGKLSFCNVLLLTNVLFLMIRAVSPTQLYDNLQSKLSLERRDDFSDKIAFSRHINDIYINGDELKCKTTQKVKARKEVKRFGIE